MDIIKDGATDYVIVCDGAEESQAFADKLNALFGEYFGIELPVFREKKRKTTGKEILIGSGKEALSGLFDFAVTVEENKLALCAPNALSYSFLLEYLKREIFKKAKCGQLILTAADNIIYSKSALKEKNFIRYWLEENEKFPYGEHFAHKSHQHGEITIPYRIYIPFNYDPDKKYPLLLNLHGAGNRGSDNKRHLLFINRPLSNPALSVDEAIILYPHCALENKWVHTNWYAGSYDLEQVPESEELKAVLEILEQVGKTYSIDPDRIYLTGYSMGGYGTWNLLMNHPDLFAAAVPMCGAGDPEKAEVIKNIPIWAIHGAKDPIVPVKGSRDMAAALEKVGAKAFRYTELPEVEHDAWNYAFNTPEIFRWLFSQQKQQ